MVGEVVVRGNTGGGGGEVHRCGGGGNIGGGEGNTDGVREEMKVVVRGG
ncbi:hypothetical protein Hamer_G005828 [Homarus americanus]|uniref:Uncharacterized protein n=1 Tax=Homarus americanus TaxID=6706 RepID=A0A8J5JKZ8_HOMAM|nr:hypothetical protein Hamer_G005828 [Homarus americanus]